MGHAISFYDFSTKTDKKIISAEMNQVARENSDCHGDLYEMLEFVDKTFDTREEAMEYIDNHDESYRNFAVKYKENKNFKFSAKLTVLNERASKTRKEYFDLNGKFHFAEHKSETVGCKHCGSKIALEYLRSNCCPVCHTDMRPDTIKNRITALKTKTEQLEKQAEQMRREEYKKQSKNAKEMWLVKIEYHV